MVAASGGPDSTALVYCLVGLQNSMNLSLHLAHLNHDFRGEEAEEDARFVSKMAKGLGLPCTVDEANPMVYQEEHKVSSFEEAAREVRYDFLTALAQKIGALAIALGHTADDQAETILMHFLRGAGLPGLMGMQEVTEWHSPRPPLKGTLYRPLLEATRMETKAYCLELGIPFREDSTNLSMKFTRNRVRHQLLPLMQGYNSRVREALVRTGRSVSEAVSYLEGELDRIWPTISTRKGDSLYMGTEGFKALHPFLQGMALRRSYGEVKENMRRLTDSHVRSMLKLAAGPPGRSVNLPGGLVMRTLGRQIAMGPAEGAEATRQRTDKEYPLEVPGVTHIPGWVVTVEMVPPPSNPDTSDPMAAFFDVDKLGSGLAVRTRREGDYFRPMGLVGRKKLKDFLIDLKIPRELRDSVPLLVSDKGILWVAPYRLSEVAKVREGTRKTVLIRWESTGSSDPELPDGSFTSEMPRAR